MSKSKYEAKTVNFLATHTSIHPPDSCPPPTPHLTFSSPLRCGPVSEIILHSLTANISLG